MNNIPLTISMRTVDAEPNNPVTVYHQAVSFYLAGHRCLLDIPTGPKTVQSLPAPSIVNFVFSIELFLKSILVKNGKSKKVHRIKELLNECPIDILNKVRKEYDNVCQSPNFNQIIDIVNDMFVQLRYQYEYPVSTLYESSVITLAQSLYIICDELYKK